MKNFPIDETLDNSDSGFEASIEVTKEADMFAALAKAYFTMFGLTDEKIIRQFTLFANQYRGLVDWRANELESETKNFRAQADLIQAFKQTHDGMGYPIKKWTIKIKVKKWFLEKLKLFGIDFTLDNLTGKVNLKSIDPIPMIDESDMKAGDIVLVDGYSYMSDGIKLATWSNYSHAAIYSGDGFIYEAVWSTVSKNPISNDINRLKLMAVLRPKNYNALSAELAVIYARGNAGEFGGPKKTYDIPGAVASGISWKLAVAFPPLFGLKVGQTVSDAIFGNEVTFFCSELVTEAYESANAPIMPVKPQNAVPGMLYYSANLARVGYLKNMP